MEDTVVTMKGSPDRMEATDVEATPGATEAIMERQELHKEEINFGNIGSLEDRYGELFGVWRR
jgi:hypothetical protein